MAKARTSAQRKMATCARECKGTSKRFQGCVSKCIKGDYRHRKSTKKKAKGRCVKWSKGRTRCMKRASR